MCRDFDRIDDNSSLRDPSNSHNSRDMFMHDMFRVARHAMREAQNEQAFWSDRRGNFNLGQSQDNKYGMQWADLDLSARPQPVSYSETRPAVYPWNSDFDWKAQIPTNLTFLRSLAVGEGKAEETDSASNPVVGQEAVALKPKAQEGFGPVPDELIIDNVQAPTKSAIETIAAAEPDAAKAAPEPARTVPEAKAKEVASVEPATVTVEPAVEKPETATQQDKETSTVTAADAPQPIIRNDKGEKEEVSFVAMKGDRNLALADMRDFRKEIEKPIPPVVFEATALDAYQKGLAEKKPVVLIIGEDWCQYCKQLEKELAKPEFQQYSGRAIFAKVQPSKDPSAKAIADALDIKNYPAISILEPNPAMIEERGRIVGYMDASKLDAHLRKLITPAKPMEKKEVMLASVDERPIVA